MKQSEIYTLSFEYTNQTDKTLTVDMLDPADESKIDDTIP